MRAGTTIRTRPARVPYRDLEDRLMHNSAQDTVSECWVWLGSRDRKGYGRVNIRKAGQHICLWAHRIAYELLVGPIPEGFQIDHLCRNPSCINPQHLEPVTPDENRARQAEALYHEDA